MPNTHQVSPRAIGLAGAAIIGAHSLMRRRGAAADVLLVVNEVAALPGPVLRQMTPLLAQAELEIANGLRGWIAAGRGESRFTAYEHALVLIQLRAAFDTIRRIDPALVSALGKGASRAGVLSAQHLASLIDRNSQRFGTSLEAPMRLDLARILATGEGLMPRFRSSATRYSEGVRDEIRRQLAVSVLKGETTSGMIERLSKRALVAPAAGSPATPATAASGLMKSAQWQLERLVRTEMARASEAQAMEAFRQARVQMPDLRRVWDARLDSKVCPWCRQMHGTVSEQNGAFEDGVVPPAHPWCRCHAVPWRPGWGELFTEAA